MIKEIKYGGLTANPNDHDSIEGDLSVAMNLVPEDGTIKPVLPPSTVATIPGDPNMPNDKGRKVLCIHKTSAYTHYIVAVKHQPLSSRPPYWYLYQWDGTDTGAPERLGMVTFNEIYSVEPVGNTLVVLADDGLHYFLWKQDAYHYLGTHLPELDLSFSLIFYSAMASDQHEVDLDGKHYVSAIRSDKDLKAKLCQAVLASANQVTAKVCEKKCFCYPFFVRYAFRLYDGNSITMHSSPQLVVPTMEAPEVLMGWTITPGESPTVDEDEAKVSAKINAYKLFHYALDSSQVDEVARWEDIISSVDIYISPLFYTYDQAIKDDEINIFGDKVLPDRDITQGIRDNGAFHLIKSIKINDIFCGDGQSTSYGVNRPSEARPRANVNASGLIIPDFEPSNDNIVVRELMTDDYGTHDELMATRSFAYNNRINLAGASRRLFNGFNPACMWAIVKENQTAKTTNATVIVEDGGKEIVVKRGPVSVFFDNDNTVVWFFYPNAGAKRAYLDINGTKLTFELTVHAMLNGAYYYGLASDSTAPQSVDTIPTPSTGDDAIVNMPNKVYTSEVDNPFYFPSTGINSISSGNILGICAAVRPMSSGQYGYADLYVFADNGIWTAKINDKGTYGNLDFATGDVCINPDSITQMETSVLFTTSRGIMLISGSQAQCISEAIDDKGQMIIPGLNDITVFSTAATPAPFDDFIQQCRMIYDYRGQRIIVYNPTTRPVDGGSAAVYPYAYIYSLESNKWGMMQSDIAYGLRAYPEALAVTHRGTLVNYSDRVDHDATPVAALLLTRPLTLDAPDILKTVNTVLQRGMFRKNQGHIRSVLYGSRDLYNWHLVKSSIDENLRGFRGSGYKWFRIGLLLQLDPGESITGCSVQFEPRQTNRLR